jgi:transposase
MSETFDANRRLAEVALWADGSARWVDRATEAARSAAPRRRQVTVTFDQAELETFVTGFRGVARMLMGLAQPVPPPISAAPQGRHLRLVT